MKEFECSLYIRIHLITHSPGSQPTPTLSPKFVGRDMRRVGWGKEAADEERSFDLVRLVKMEKFVSSVDLSASLLLVALA